MAMDALTLQHSARCAVVTSAAGASKASPRHACAPVEVKATKVQQMLNPVTANTGSCSNVGRNSSNRRRDYACLAVHAERGTREVKKEEGQHNMALQDRPILLRNQDVQRTVAAPDSISYLAEFRNNDAEAPSWFSPALENKLPQNAPVILFLPEVFGTDLGFAMQQKSLGMLFQVRCLRIPVMDRTPFEGLVSFVERTVREEATLHSDRPVYLIGESFGGSVALAVASRNPELDLMLVLVNPTTSFDKSPLQRLTQAFPSAMIFPAVRILLGFIGYDRKASQFAMNVAPPHGAGQISESPEHFSNDHQSFLEILNALPDPGSVVSWKLELLRAGARYVNSRLSAITKAQVLILASATDVLLPSLKEAKRLTKILPSCEYRKVSRGGHMLLMEKGFDLSASIRAAGLYRRTRNSNKDLVCNFVRPTAADLERTAAANKWLRSQTSPVFFSTRDDGQVVRTFSMFPVSDRPVIVLGNHLVNGFDGELLWEENMRNGWMPWLRGLSHPNLFDKEMAEIYYTLGDKVRLHGCVSSSGRNMHKLLARGDSVVQYPGGGREAFRRKNEWNRIFWPQKPEVIRMAAKFGAIIVPMVAVGDDECLEILLDYNDLIKLPIVGRKIRENAEELLNMREGTEGEVGDQPHHFPVTMPKIGPGRLYFMMGKPIYTEGREEYFRDPKNVEEEYKLVKAAVEDGIAYLLRKREEDPYRKYLPRILYEMRSGKQAPTFEP